MYEEFEHYHCSICGESYRTQEKADDCFWNHSELEIMRWIAFELVSFHHFSEMGGAPLRRDEMAFSTEFLKELNERFRVAEIDETGWIWSLAIKGKRL